MERKQPLGLLFLKASDGTDTIVNLDQVHVYDQIADSHVRLVFDAGHEIQISGPAAKEVIALLAANCIITDGTPLPEFVERVRSQSRSSKPSANPTPES